MAGTFNYNSTYGLLTLTISGLPATDLTLAKTGSSSIVINFASAGIKFKQSSPSNPFFTDFTWSWTGTVHGGTLTFAILAGEFPNTIILNPNDEVNISDCTGFTLTMQSSMLDAIPSIPGVFEDVLSNITFTTITFKDLFATSDYSIPLTIT